MSKLTKAQRREARPIFLMVGLGILLLLIAAVLDFPFSVDREITEMIMWVGVSISLFGMGGFLGFVCGIEAVEKQSTS